MQTNSLKLLETKRLESKTVISIAKAIKNADIRIKPPIAQKYLGMQNLKIVEMKTPEFPSSLPSTGKTTVRKSSTD